MALFNAALGTSIGLGLGLQAKPEDYANIAQENIRYGRAEEDRKRKEAAKQKQEEDDRYAHLLDKIKVEGYGALWDTEISKKAANVIGKINDFRTQSPHRDPLSDPEINKSYQDLLIQTGEAKKASEATNKTLETYFNNPDKQTYDPEILNAIHTGNREAFTKLTGVEPEKANYGLGLKAVEKQFDDLAFKKKVNEAYKPFEKTIEYKNPNTGNWETKVNNYYQDPNSSVNEALTSDAHAADFYKKQFDAMPVSRQKEYGQKSQSEGGTGSAYTEFAKERLFPQEGTKSKLTIQEPISGTTKIDYTPIPGGQEILPKPFDLTNIPKDKKIIGKIDHFIPLDQTKTHKMIDVYGNIIDASDVRKIIWDDGTIGYEGKTTEESRIKKSIKNINGITQIVDEVLPQYSQIVFPYEKNRQIEAGEKGLKRTEEIKKDKGEDLRKKYNY